MTPSGTTSKIEMRDQPRLTTGRIARITLSGIRYRLFRSLVTIVVIAVAVAFLMNILSESFIKRGVSEHTAERITESRTVHVWAARLTHAGSRDDLIDDLAQAAPGTPFYTECAAFGGLDAEAMRSFHDAVRTYHAALSFADALPYDQHRRLFHAAEGTELLDRLATPEGWTHYVEARQAIRAVRFQFTVEEWQALVAEWPAVAASLDAILQGRAEAVRALHPSLEGRQVMEALTGAGAAFGEAIRAAGFELTGETARLIADQARLQWNRQQIELMLRERDVIAAIARRVRKEPMNVTGADLWPLLSDHTGAQWYADILSRAGVLPAHIDAEAIVDAHDYRREERALSRAEFLTMDFGTGWLGLGVRMAWLLSVSMLVCAIGICNAMLMAVTERFREIATMKCLGALDGFIMTLFVFEACFLGLVGGLIGALLGGALGSLRMLAAFGPRFLDAFPVASLLGGAGAALLSGIILAAAAAVYPSLRAARLSPMEAMRIE